LPEHGLVDGEGEADGGDAGDFNHNQQNNGTKWVL